MDQIFATSRIDAVMHFAAIAYVAESMEEPLRYGLLLYAFFYIHSFPFVWKVIHDFKCVVLIRYYKNITSNTLILLEAMKKHGVKKLIYSSTCATYGEPEKMPITEETPQVIWSTSPSSILYLGMVYFILNYLEMVYIWLNS